LLVVTGLLAATGLFTTEALLIILFTTVLLAVTGLLTGTDLLAVAGFAGDLYGAACEYPLPTDPIISKAGRKLFISE